MYVVMNKSVPFDKDKKDIILKNENYEEILNQVRNWIKSEIYKELIILEKSYFGDYKFILKINKNYEEVIFEA